MAKLTVNVDIKDLDIYKELISIMKDMTEDERIPVNVREEYKDRTIGIVYDAEEKQDTQSAPVEQQWEEWINTTTFNDLANGFMSYKEKYTGKSMRVNVDGSGCRMSCDNEGVKDSQEGVRINA